jgi:DNA-binding response OmpR family regulator
MILETESYEILVAHDAEAGMKIIYSGWLDLIILDVVIKLNMTLNTEAFL